ncbi:MAG: hypothetical protein J5605_08600 [Bacteroidales bacterium]|nr:hypothetical protein [Bacteroidales bacterium]
MAKYLCVVEYEYAAVILAGGTITALPTSACGVPLPWASWHGWFKCNFLAHFSVFLFNFVRFLFDFGSFLFDSGIVGGILCRSWQQLVYTYRRRGIPFHRFAVPCISYNGDCGIVCGSF